MNHLEHKGLIFIEPFNERTRLKEDLDKDEMLELLEQSLKEKPEKLSFSLRKKQDIAYKLINTGGEIKRVINGEKGETIKIDGIFHQAECFIEFFKDGRKGRESDYSIRGGAFTSQGIVERSGKIEEDSKFFKQVYVAVTLSSKSRLRLFWIIGLDPTKPI